LHETQSPLQYQAQNKKTPFLGIQSPEPEPKTLRDYFPDLRIQVSPHVDELVDILQEEGLLAVFRGRSEIGKRALGNRSILAHPTRPGIKDYLNSHIKFREKFRPYGIIILEQEVENYFQDSSLSPFMSHAPKVRSDKLDVFREIMHPNQRIRIQTINQFQYPALHQLLRAFHDHSGIPFLINTSLNIMGQPILETLKDLRSFQQKSPIKNYWVEEMLLTKM
jgi:carbamoyltransferase